MLAPRLSMLRVRKKKRARKREESCRYTLGKVPESRVERVQGFSSFLLKSSDEREGESEGERGSVSWYQYKQYDK